MAAAALVLLLFRLKQRKRTPEFNTTAGVENRLKRLPLLSLRPALALKRQKARFFILMVPPFGGGMAVYNVIIT